MEKIMFTSTERSDSTVRISDLTESVWTIASAATAGDIQEIADAYLDGYDGDGVVEFEIFALDDEGGITLARCTGEHGGPATCDFAE